MNESLLDVRDLSVSFHTDDGVFQAVDHVSLHVNSGEIVGLVGESGCGKSVTSLSILRLIPAPPGKIDTGQVYFKGRDLLKLDSDNLRQIRGKSISMIFQEPLSALSPLQRIGQQLVEALRIHSDISKKRPGPRPKNGLKRCGFRMRKSACSLIPFSCPAACSSGWAWPAR